MMSPGEEGGAVSTVVVVVVVVDATVGTYDKPITLPGA